MEHFPLATEAKPGGSCREMERENSQQEYSPIKTVYLGVVRNTHTCPEQR
jgi:hypothetical protein